MKILQINKLYYPSIGGIETAVKDIAEGLNNKNEDINIDIDILTCQEKGKRKIENIKGINIYRSASWGKLLGMPISLDFFFLFLKIKNNYDIFIVHFPFPLATLITPFIPRSKLIIFYHCDVIRQKISIIPFIPLIKYSLKKAKNIIVSGKNIINSSPFLRRNKKKCVVIPFGIDVDFNNDDIKKSEDLKKIYGDKLILSVGRLVYYKGFEYAIKAMLGVDAHLLIIGQGPESNKLNKIIEKLNLKNKITIIKPQQRLQPFLLASKIFLFPSTEKSEAFGIVQIEAMAAGLPIINTYLNTAVEEVSLNDITGITINPKNSSEISKAVNKILTDHTLRERYGKNSIVRYKLFFKKQEFLKKIKCVLFN